MKNQLITIGIILFSLGLWSCNSNKDQKSYLKKHWPLTDVNDTFSQFIPVDTANKMIGSYLNSIDFQHNDTDLQSLIVNAAQLRRYLDSMPNSSSITHLKLMFAHTLVYANSAKANTNAGYQSKALTLVIAGYDSSGNYIFLNDNNVLDYTQPCPPICAYGKAANPFISNL